ncbi:MAG: hypothetical protein RLZZ44_482 [Bacteroidota bacterium]|jgi:hypothetical protein
MKKSMKLSHHKKTLLDTNDYSKVKKELKIDSRRLSRRRFKQDFLKNSDGE